MTQLVNPYQSPQADAPIQGAELPGDDGPPPFSSPRPWGWTVCVLLVICMALSAVAVWLNLRIGASDDDLQNPTLFAWLDKLLSGIYACRLLTALPFLLWFYRAYRNLPALGHSSVDCKPAWVVLCWFIPIMNWFCPYLVMVELYRRSCPSFDFADPRKPAAILVKSWWGSFLISGLCAFIVERFDTDPSAFWLQTSYLLFTFLSAGLAIWMILEIDTQQFARFDGMCHGPDRASRHATGSE